MSTLESQYCTFRVGQMFFGLEVEQVQEVIRFQSMTRVPLAPAEVHGLINLRGQIVTAIDMRTRMGLPHLDDELPMNVILTGDYGAVSLLVDEIGDVIEVEDELFEHPPNTLGRDVRELVRGVYKLDGQLLLILDATAAIQIAA
ncbi:MAG: chemotaxis protein CheW [Myxococcota bacterium]